MIDPFPGVVPRVLRTSFRSVAFQTFPQATFTQPSPSPSPSPHRPLHPPPPFLFSALLLGRQHAVLLPSELDPRGSLHRGHRQSQRCGSGSSFPRATTHSPASMMPIVFAFQNTPSSHNISGLPFPTSYGIRTAPVWNPRLLTLVP